MAKLATLRTIRAIEPIQGADRIVRAWVDGWACIVKVGEFEVGDVGLYMEVDTALPVDNPIFAFLAARKVRELEGGNYHVLKTLKLKGVLSQGLLLPLEPFEAQGLTFYPDDFDHDYGEELKLLRYDPEIHGGNGGAKLAGNALRRFPGFIPKTDQIRLQNNLSVLNDTRTYESTIKLEGSSCTVYYNANDQHDYGVCSRSLQLKHDDPINIDNAFVSTALKYNLETKLRAYNKNIAIQMELIGPKIQGNIEKLSEYKLFVYDVFDIDKQVYLPPLHRHNLVKYLELDHVPILSYNIVPSYFDLQSALDYAEGPSLVCDCREGVVLKCNEPDAYGTINSFKIISNAYLLKN